MLAQVLVKMRAGGDELNDALLPLAFRMLVLASLLTLLCNPPLLFMNELRPCSAGFSVNLFCLGVSAPFVRWFAIIVCVISLGPRMIPGCVVVQWIVAHSIRLSIGAADGGDSITANLLLLLIPLSLWIPNLFSLRGSALLSPQQELVLRATFLLIAFQMAVVYFDAAITKVYVPEWRDGTALFYILTMPGFGGLEPTSFLWPFVASRAVGALTYGTLFLEFLLAFAWIATSRVKGFLLLAGLGFHAMIALIMGLPTFGLAMGAGLLLYLRPLTVARINAQASRARVSVGDAPVRDVDAAPASALPVVGRRAALLYSYIGG